jgi:Uma2 family endonuclease
MSSVPATTPISVPDYLASELVSQVKREYLGGVVYMMAGARNVHNLISGNFFGTLHFRLRGHSCRPYNSDTKIRVQLPTQIRFYYPDASVVRLSNPGDDSYQDQPVVVMEVLSRKTRRIDEGEKKDAYLTIPSLAVYLLIEQESPVVTVYRRTEQGFVREVFAELEATIPLSEIGTELPLAELYEGVQFSAEPDDDERHN